MLFGLVVLGLALAASMYIPFPLLVGRCSRLLLSARCRSRRCLVLTWDDGPGWRLTPRILDVLKEHRIRGTFFLLGRNIQGREAIVRRIAAEGHDVCSHGFAHLHDWRILPWRGIQEVRRGWQAIDGALGTHKGRYPFRPPNGKLNLLTLLYLWAERIPIIFWTCDIGDTWLEEHKDGRLNRQWDGLRHGGVVLSHDFDRSTDVADEYVLESLQRCLSEADRLGLKVCSMSELRAGRTA